MSIWNKLYKENNRYRYNLNKHNHLCTHKYKKMEFFRDLLSQFGPYYIFIFVSCTGLAKSYSVSKFPLCQNQNHQKFESTKFVCLKEIENCGNLDKNTLKFLVCIAGYCYDSMCICNCNRAFANGRRRAVYYRNGNYVNYIAPRGRGGRSGHTKQDISEYTLYQYLHKMGPYNCDESSRFTALYSVYILPIQGRELFQVFMDLYAKYGQIPAQR